MGKKRKILIADDDEENRELVNVFTKKLFPEYELELFEEGASLRKRLEGLVGKENNVKLVLTDNQMPGYEGSELIKEYSRKINFPMILIYGGFNGIGKQAVENGAYGFLQKPFGLDEFKKMAESALEK